MPSVKNNKNGGKRRLCRKWMNKVRIPPRNKTRKAKKKERERDKRTNKQMTTKGLRTVMCKDRYFHKTRNYLLDS